MIQDFSPFGQTSSLFERGDLPLPSGVVSPGSAPIVAVTTAPRHPSNAVLVEMRRDGGPATFLRAMPEGAPFQADQQWYTAALPTLDEGHRINYRVELIRAGQRLAGLPADGSWLAVTGDRASTSVASAESPKESADTAPSGALRCASEMTFLATLTAKLRPEIIGSSPEGYRINFFIQSGRVVGSRIDAVVRPNGGDWICVRPDGVARPDVRITLEMADGALVLYQAGGVCDLGSDGYARIAAGQFTGTHPYYPTPTFLTAHPDWKWLNRCQGFGIGRVVMDDLRVECDIYLPQVLERRSDG
ncbi:MAG: DUF3237 domain-containing protein [Pseudonocardiaceae bacterium]